DSFLGEGWAAIVLNDCLRLASGSRLTERLPAAGVSGCCRGEEVAWVEPGELEEAYPAMFELVTNLHALPFELNCKAGLRLSRPFRASTMVLRLRDGCGIPLRLDSLASGEETGHKVTCVYFVGRGPAGACPENKKAGDNNQENATRIGGNLLLRTKLSSAPTSSACAGSGSCKGARTCEEGECRILPGVTGDVVGAEEGKGVQQGCTQVENGGLEGGGGSEREVLSGGETGSEGWGSVMVVDAVPDRVVLFRSDRVLNETSPVVGSDQYAVVFWMHGAK
ncbi:unnamed protein product, partial [Choristocarpus tenellus]